jgi:hypothetical protein
MENKTLTNHENGNDANRLLAAGKIVVLQGRIAHIKGNNEDLIIRLTDDFLQGIDKIIEAINLGYGNIRDATITEKEYWFLCHDNSNEDFGICTMKSYREWIACR